jgi:hypothetical protein
VLQQHVNHKISNALLKKGTTKPTRHGPSRTSLGLICVCMNLTTREALSSPTTLSQGTPRRTRQTLDLHAALLQDYDCTEQPAEDLPALPSGAGGCGAANAGALPPPLPERSQDTGSVTLVLPQLNHLHEAYEWRQVAPPVSSSFQDQQPTVSGPILTQRGLTQQLTAHWPQFKILHQSHWHVVLGAEQLQGQRP